MRPEKRQLGWMTNVTPIPVEATSFWAGMAPQGPGVPVGEPRAELMSHAEMTYPADARIAAPEALA